MEYPETLTAELLLEHVGHELTVERFGLDCFTYFKTVGATVDCLTCGDRITLEWCDSTPAPIGESK